MGNAILRDDTPDETAFADELAAGATLMHGQYRIENFLNAGGFGITYAARDSLERRVVIKECFPGAFCRRSTALVQARSRAHQNELASIVRLFVQEAKSLSKLRHPYIVGVHQVFEENNTAYMALDFVEGKDLLAVIEDETALSAAEIENILRKVLEAIGFIHEQGILHRDISPDNILMNEEGDPVLIDFGAAREQATKQSRVLSALRVVKDGYSPQEFYIAGSEQGPYSDLYALGATFYHLITGDVPPNSQARLSAVASGESDPYQALAGRVTGHDKNLLASVDMALAILPKDRIPSAQAWIDMMDGKGAPVKAASAARPVEARKPRSRKGMLMATAAVLAMVAAGAAFQTGMLDEALGTAGLGTDVAIETDAVPVAPATDEPEAARATVTEETVAQTDAPSEPVSVPVTASVDLLPPASNTDEIALQGITPDSTGVDIALVAPELDFNAALEAALADLQGQDTVALLSEIEAKRVRATLDLALQALPRPEAFMREVGSFEIEARPGSLDLNSLISGSSTPFDRSAQEYAMLVQPEADAAFAVDTSVPPPPLPLADVVPGLAQGWKVVLPYSGLFDAAEGETRVFAVNGIAVDSIDAFHAAVQRTTRGIPEDVSLSLVVETGTTANDLTEQTWSLPIAYQTHMANGLTFDVTNENGVWVTRITEVPGNLPTDIKSGDVVFGYIPTSELLQGKDDIYSILSRELQAGTQQFSFAVNRGEVTWVVNFVIDPAQFAKNNG